MNVSKFSEMKWGKVFKKQLEYEQNELEEIEQGEPCRFATNMI